MAKLGARNWSLIAKAIPGRSGKSCRLRWVGREIRATTEATIPVQLPPGRHSAVPNACWCTWDPSLGGTRSTQAPSQAGASGSSTMRGAAFLPAHAAGTSPAARIRPFRCMLTAGSSPQRPGIRYWAVLVGWFARAINRLCIPGRGPQAAQRMLAGQQGLIMLVLGAPKPGRAGCLQTPLAWAAWPGAVRTT